MLFAGLKINLHRRRRHTFKRTIRTFEASKVKKGQKCRCLRVLVSFRQFEQCIATNNVAARQTHWRIVGCALDFEHRAREYRVKIAQKIGQFDFNLQAIFQKRKDMKKDLKRGFALREVRLFATIRSFFRELAH